MGLFQNMYHSTAESEYVAMAAAALEYVWLRLSNTGLEDNQSAIAMTKIYPSISWQDQTH